MFYDINEYCVFYFRYCICWHVSTVFSPKCCQGSRLDVCYYNGTRNGTLVRAFFLFVTLGRASTEDFRQRRLFNIFIKYCRLPLNFSSVAKSHFIKVKIVEQRSWHLFKRITLYERFLTLAWWRGCRVVRSFDPCS